MREDESLIKAPENSQILTFYQEFNVFFVKERDALIGALVSLWLLNGLSNYALSDVGKGYKVRE